MTEELVASFAALFHGRVDCYGSWGGGCVKQPLTIDVFRKHLYSADPQDWIGVYPCVASWCSWGCVDIDFDDLQLARNLQGALAFKGITSWIERTTKGFHVWVFPEENVVPSKIMRRCLQAACAAIGYEPKEINPKAENVGEGVGNYVRACYQGALSNGFGELDEGEHHLAGGPDGGGRRLLHQAAGTQEARRPSGGATDVRSGRSGAGSGDCGCGRGDLSGRQGQALPQQGVERHLALASPEGGRRHRPDVGALPVDGRTQTATDSRLSSRVVLDPVSGAPLCLSCFLELAHKNRTPVSVLAEVASLYTPPEIGRVAVEAMPIDKTITDKMSGRTWTIYKDGPLPGSDRSSTMTRLAHLMAEDGLTPSEAYAVLAACHFNKYRDRKDEAEQLQRIIDRAYS